MMNLHHITMTYTGNKLNPRSLLMQSGVFCCKMEVDLPEMVDNVLNMTIAD